jgi:hypothetical protein
MKGGYPRSSARLLYEGCGHQQPCSFKWIISLRACVADETQLCKAACICFVSAGTSSIDGPQSTTVSLFFMMIVPGLNINDFGVDYVNKAEGKRKCWPRVHFVGNREWIRVEPFVGDFSCPTSQSHSAYINLPVKWDSHGLETRMAISAWFERRMDELATAAQKQEIQALCFSYVRADRGSSKALKAALNCLSWFKQKDRVVALMLAAWKNLAQSRSSEQTVKVEVKDLRVVMELYNHHRDDWKRYKTEVYDAGQVHLVEKLVRPFSEPFSSFQW